MAVHCCTLLVALAWNRPAEHGVHVCLAMRVGALADCPAPQTVCGTHAVAPPPPLVYVLLGHGVHRASSRVISVSLPGTRCCPAPHVDVLALQAAFPLLYWPVTHQKHAVSSRVCSLLDPASHLWPLSQVVFLALHVSRNHNNNIVLTCNILHH